MKNEDILRRLNSKAVADRIAATYELDENLIKSDPAILEAVRENLHSSDVDLAEITIMRLSLRAKDCASFEAIAEMFASAENALVLSACAFALTSLADCGDVFRSRSLSLLKAKLASTTDQELKLIFEKETRRLEN